MSSSAAAVLVMHSHGQGITFHLAQLAIAMARIVEPASLDLHAVSMGGEQFAGLWSAVGEVLPMDRTTKLGDESDLARVVQPLLERHECVVVNVQGLRQLKILAATKRRHRERLRIILTVNSFRNGTWKRVPYSALAYFVCRRLVDRAVFLSPFSCHEFVGGRSLLKRGMATIIPWGVEPWSPEQLNTPTVPVGDPDLRPICADPSLLRLVYLASFTKIKRHRWLVDAIDPVLRRHPAARLLLVGDGSTMSDIRQRIAFRDLHSQVILPGRIDRHFVPWLVTHCHAAIVASRSETFGHAFAEPLVNGVPVVGTRVGLGEWAIQDGITGYGFATGDVRGFRSRMNDLLSDVSHRDEMGANARRFLGDHLTWQNTARAYLSLYRSLADTEQQ